MMRYLLISFVLLGSAAAAEPYPLWDGHESVAEYARRVNLPPAKTLDLGNGVKLELVLIPAGKFMMGTPEPAPVDEEGLQTQIIHGQALLAVGASVLLVFVCTVLIRAIRKRQRPKLSLSRLLAITALAGLALLSGMHWNRAVRQLQADRTEYSLARARYNLSMFWDKHAHPVTLTQPFYMGKFPVVQEQYQQVMGRNPSVAMNKQNPVQNASWDEAQEFCKKAESAAGKERLSIRLPTEAEWEFACRAGTRTTYYSGDEASDLERIGWPQPLSKMKPHPVGQKQPNAFGLFDMLGCIAQWCQDRFHPDYYSVSPVDDPKGPEQGEGRVVRGGSWFNVARDCRSATRGWYDQNIPDDRIGFRIVADWARSTEATAP